jgi:hypothetical protein
MSATACAALHLLAKPGILAGQRARHPDQDVGPSGRAEAGGKNDHGHGYSDQAAHDNACRPR